METKELIGKKYGRLNVEGFEIERKQGKNRIQSRVYLICKCECGTEVRARKDSVLSGAIVSCGCNRREKAHYSGIKHAQSCITHNMSKTRLYGIWRSMKSRCYNKTCGGFQNYGGRGVTVCDDWKNSFEKFKDWAISNGYKDNLSIDRINVKGNYEPTNCRWITMLDQQSNKTTNHYITYQNKTLTLSQWSRELNIPISTIFNRIRRGKSLVEILTK